MIDIIRSPKAARTRPTVMQTAFATLVLSALLTGCGSTTFVSGGMVTATASGGRVDVDSRGGRAEINRDGLTARSSQSRSRYCTDPATGSLVRC